MRDHIEGTPLWAKLYRSPLSKPLTKSHLDDQDFRANKKMALSGPLIQGIDSRGPRQSKAHYRSLQLALLFPYLIVKFFRFRGRLDFQLVHEPLCEIQEVLLGL